jgi:hypothetical protein
MMMPDREKAEEWARDFKAYVDELDIARDDYRGIMEYIDDALALLREQEPEKPLSIRKIECPACGMTWAMLHRDRIRFCPGCGRKV